MTLSLWRGTAKSGSVDLPPTPTGGSSASDPVNPRCVYGSSASPIVAVLRGTHGPKSPGLPRPEPFYHV